MPETYDRARTTAESLLGDVKSLLDHHPAQQDPQPGKPQGPGYGPLLRSATALCYTAWEVYVEEALKDSVRFVVDHRDPQDLPEALRVWIQNNASDPWLFTGDSWRKTVMDKVTMRLEGDSEGRYGFNTASVPNVESIFNEVIGYCPLREISWQKRSNKAVREKVSSLVRVRGEIVHRGSTPGTLNLGGVREWVQFVDRLTSKFDEKLIEFRRPS